MADETLKEVEETKEAATMQETSEVPSTPTQVPSSQEEKPTKKRSSSKKKKLDEEEDAVANAAGSSDIEEDEKISEATTAEEKAEVAKVEDSEQGGKSGTPVKKQYKPEVEGGITKFFLFKNKRKEYREVDDFLTTNVFKRVRVRFWVSNLDFDFDYKEVQAKIKNYVYKTINTNRIEEVDVIDCPERSKYVLNTAYNAIDILVPYNPGTARLINGFKLMVKTMNSENKDIQFKLKIESCASFEVDTSKGHEDSIIKGFAACSFMEGREENTPPKVFLKAGMFVDSEIEYDKHDIQNANEILSVVRVKEYNHSEKGESIRYIMPFKSKFSLVTYQVVDFQPNGKLKVQRTLNRYRIRNVSVAKITIPIGVYLTRRKDLISVSSFEKFFVDTCCKERKNANSLETYCQLQTGTYEVEQFAADCNLIDEIFLDSINIERTE